MRHRAWFSKEAAAVRETTGKSDPLAAMQKMAADLIDRAGLTGPPFDPELLASWCNVREVRRVPMRSAARLIPDGPRLLIEVNQDHSVGKQNFSIDHEISHTLIPTYANARIDDAETGTFSDNSEEELLCDIGAAALLLEPRWLAGFAYEASPSLEFLREMKTTFQASLEATARQLATVAPWPVALVFWEIALRKAEREWIPEGQLLLPELAMLAGPQPKVRVASCYCAPSFPYFLPPNKSVSQESLVTSCAESGQQTLGIEVFDFGKSSGTAELYCENMYAPYRRGHDLRSRVISMLLPVDERIGGHSSVPSFELEVL